MELFVNDLSNLKGWRIKERSSAHYAFGFSKSCWQCSTPKVVKEIKLLQDHRNYFVEWWLQHDKGWYGARFPRDQWWNRICFIHNQWLEKGVSNGVSVFAVVLDYFLVCIHHTAKDTWRTSLSWIGKKVAVELRCRSMYLAATGYCRYDCINKLKKNWTDLGHQIETSGWILCSHFGQGFWWEKTWTKSFSCQNSLPW